MEYLEENAKICFTTNQWNGSSFTTYLGILCYTVGQHGLAPGSIRNWSNKVNTAPWSITNDFALSENNKGIYAYAGEITAPTHLYMVAGSTTVLIPAELSTNSAYTIQTSAPQSGVYTGSTTGTLNELIGLIHTPTNWNIQDSVFPAMPSGYFTVNSNVAASGACATDGKWGRTAAGQQAKAVCEAGYEGFAARLCLDNGGVATWGNIDNNSCIKSTCPALPNLLSTTSGVTLSYPCPAGFSGVVTQQCSSTFVPGWSVPNYSGCSSTITTNAVLITGYNNANNKKEISFLATVSLPEGLELYITNLGWRDNNEFHVLGQIMKYTVPRGGLSAGSVFVWTGTYTNGFTMNTGTSFDFNANNEQLFIFIGSVDNPIFIFGLHYGPNGWKTSGKVADRGESYLPAQLSGKALLLDGSNYGSAKYTGSSSYTLAITIENLKNKSNWQGNNAGVTIDTNNWTTTGASCSAVSNWPTTASNNLATIKCPFGYVGSQTRSCIDGIWTSVNFGCSQSHTTLTPTSVGILALNTVGTKGFSMAVLRNIVPNEQILFTTNEWTYGGQSFVDLNNVLIYTAPAAGNAAGSVITWQGENDGTLWRMMGTFSLPATNGRLFIVSGSLTDIRMLYAARWGSQPWGGYIPNDTVGLPADVVSALAYVEITTGSSFKYMFQASGTPSTYMTNMNDPLKYQVQTTGSVTFYTDPITVANDGNLCAAVAGYAETPVGSTASVPCAQAFTGIRTRTCTQSGSTPVWGPENTSSCIPRWTYGDIVIAGFNSDTPDSVLLIFMKYFPAGTRIYLTDKGYRPTLNTFYAGEGMVAYDLPEDKYPGDTLIWKSTENNLPGGWTTSGDFNPNTTADSVFCFVGDNSSINYNYFQIMYGINYAGPTWDADSTNSSTCGEDTACTAAHACMSIEHHDNFFYQGITRGTKNELLLSLYNMTNWIYKESGTYDFTTVANWVIEAEATGVYCDTDGEWPRTTAGETAYTTCSLGYTGHKSRVCNTNGVWSNVPDISKCQPIYCEADGVWPQTQAGLEGTASCPVGLAGFAKRPCSFNGIWEEPNYSTCTRDFPVGGLAVVHFCSGNPDIIVIVVLNEVPVGTEIFITDVGYNPDTKKLIGAENLVSYTVKDEPLYPGSLIKFQAGDASTTWDNVHWKRYRGGVGFGLATAGDEIFLYLGSEAYPFFIYGLGFFADDWITSGSIDGYTSGLPDDLQTDNQIAGPILGHYYNGIYQGPTNGTRFEILSNIKNKSNWRLTNTYIPQMYDTVFQVTDSSASSHCPTLGVWNSAIPGQVQIAPCPFGFTGNMTRICRLNGLWGDVSDNSCTLGDSSDPMTLGDIAVIQFNAADALDTTNLQFTLLVLRDLPAGFEIKVTDNGMSVSISSWKKTEGILSYVVPAGGIKAGQLIKYPDGVTPSNWVEVSLPSRFMLESQRDQLYVYAGPESSSIVLYGIRFGEGATWSGDEQDDMNGVPSVFQHNNKTAVTLPSGHNWRWKMVQKASKNTIISSLYDPKNWENSINLFNSVAYDSVEILSADSDNGNNNTNPVAITTTIICTAVGVIILIIILYFVFRITLSRKRKSQGGMKKLEKTKGSRTNMAPTKHQPVRV